MVGSAGDLVLKEERKSIAGYVSVTSTPIIPSTVSGEEKKQVKNKSTRSDDQN